MKKKIHKILGIGLAFVLAVSLSIGMVAPVAAADYEENDWGSWGLPDLDADTDIGPIAIAPDGTLYAAVFYYDDDEADWFWKVCMSEDDGYTWDDTDIDELESDSTAEQNCIVSIVVSPTMTKMKPSTWAYTKMRMATLSSGASRMPVTIPPPSSPSWIATATRPTCSTA
jgi:hypothetical protein